MLVVLPIKFCVNGNVSTTSDLNRKTFGVFGVAFPFDLPAHQRPFGV